MDEEWMMAFMKEMKNTYCLFVSIVSLLYLFV